MSKPAPIHLGVTHCPLDNMLLAGAIPDMPCREVQHMDTGLSNTFVTSQACHTIGLCMRGCPEVTAHTPD